MGKLYTLDGKLLTETPELRIGEKVYPVDSRQKTVKKILALSDDESVPMGERIDEALKLAPVSYTHLDVYKRQAGHCEGLRLGRNHRRRSIRRAGHW